MSQNILKLAFDTLNSFKESSLYEDYQEHDGFTDEDYEKMLQTLEKILVPEKSVQDALKRWSNGYSGPYGGDRDQEAIDANILAEEFVKLKE